MLLEDFVQSVLACLGYCTVLIPEVVGPFREICMNENDILPAGMV